MTTSSVYSREASPVTPDLRASTAEHRSLVRFRGLGYAVAHTALSNVRAREGARKAHSARARGSITLAAPRTAAVRISGTVIATVHAIAC